MSNINLKPQRLCVLAADEQIKAYVHPTRILILQVLAKGKRTVSSIAREFGVHPANITHHFKLLERSGLIRLVEKRDTGRNLEKHYRAIAFAFAVKPRGRSTANRKALALSILKSDLEVAVNSVEETDDKKVVALLASARITTDEAGRFIARLENLVKEFQAHEAKTGTTYNINVSLYPAEVDRLADEKGKVSLKI